MNRLNKTKSAVFQNCRFYLFRDYLINTEMDLSFFVLLAVLNLLHLRKCGPFSVSHSFYSLSLSVRCPDMTEIVLTVTLSLNQ